MYYADQSSFFFLFGRYVSSLDHVSSAAIQGRSHFGLVVVVIVVVGSLLYGGLRESKSSKIKLEDTPWQAFQVLLEYMYTGQIQTLEFQVGVHTCVCWCIDGVYGMCGVHESKE